MSHAVTCSLTNATAPSTILSAAACQHGGRDEREIVEKVSKMRDVGRDRRVCMLSVPYDVYRSIALVAHSLTFPRTGDIT